MSRDDEHFIATYRDTVGELYAAVSSWSRGDHELAEDLVQETYLRAVRSWRTGLPDNPAGWLRTVARNLFLNEVRRTRHRARGSAALEPTSTTTTEEAVAVEQALAGIGAESAEMLRAFHVEGLSTTEIAAAHRLSDRAVEGRLHRARRAMRRLLRRDDPQENAS